MPNGEYGIVKRNAASLGGADAALRREASRPVWREPGMHWGEGSEQFVNGTTSVLASERQTRCPDSPRNPAWRQIGDGHLTQKHRHPPPDRGRAVLGPWYHPCLPRPCGRRPRSTAAMWLIRETWYSPGIVAMHRPCNGSLLPGSPGPVAAYLACWPFGALLESLFPWRS